MNKNGSAETLEEKQKRVEAQSLLVNLVSRKSMFSSYPSIFGGSQQQEPKLVAQLTINGEEWEIWEGTFINDRGICAQFEWVLCLRHLPKDEKSTNLREYRRHFFPIFSSYKDWKYMLEATKRDTVQACLTRYLNKEEHEGILSREGR